jgi:hypothetical protein
VSPRHAAANGMPSPSATSLSAYRQGKKMMLIAGTLFAAVAVIAVALEATGPAIVLGGIAAWMITH